MKPSGTPRARNETGDEILRQSEVLQITKLSRTTIWRLRKQRREI
jgi:predicted DNA-binding transcriptional regulator AlpA